MQVSALTLINVLLGTEHVAFTSMKDLEIQNYKGKLHFQLIWIRYSICIRRGNQQEMENDFDLSPTNFPPFWFSRVKSYSSSTSSPLEWPGDFCSWWKYNSWCKGVMWQLLSAVIMRILGSGYTEGWKIFYGVSITAGSSSFRDEVDQNDLNLGSRIRN